MPLQYARLKSQLASPAVSLGMGLLLAIVLALLVIGSVAIIKVIGPKVLQMYVDTDDSLP